MQFYETAQVDLPITTRISTSYCNHLNYFTVPLRTYFYGTIVEKGKSQSLTPSLSSARAKVTTCDNKEHIEFHVVDGAGGSRAGVERAPNTYCSLGRVLERTSHGSRSRLTGSI